MTDDNNFETAAPASESTGSADSVAAAESMDPVSDNAEAGDSGSTTNESADTEFGHEASNGSQSQQKGPDEQYCSSCGSVIKKQAEICPECGVRQQGATGHAANKSPGVAALLSFIFTGTGQIYNGQVAKGIGFIALQIVNVMLMFLLIGIFTYLATWGYAIYDAYNTAEKINNGQIQV